MNERTTMKTRVRNAIAILIILVTSAGGVSARIGYGAAGVDDASTLWAGVWEVGAGILGGGGYKFEGSKIDLVSVPMSLRYGWKERLEFGFDVPFAYQKSDNPQFEGSGLSDARFGIKYQMSENQRNTPASATELKLGWGPNSTVGSHAFSAGVFYSLSRAFGSGESFGHMNLGYTYYALNRSDVFSWGFAYERRIRDLMRGSLSLHSGSQPMPGLKKDIVLEAGVAQEAGPTMEYTASVGVGVTSAAPDWQLRLGLRKEFGDRAGEATSFRRAEWARPPDPTVAEIIHLGEAAMKNRDYELAVDKYRAAIAADSTQASAWNNLGIALFNLGRAREALEAYQQASRLDPENADVYFNIGLVNYRMGDLIASRRAFARALEINPGHELAKSNLIALEGTRDEK